MQQSSSVTPWRPDTKHTQASDSVSEFLSYMCTVHILMSFPRENDN